jgi:hypothetical protein
VAYAFSPYPRTLAQVSGGRFSREDTGVAVEVVRPHGNHGLWRVVGAWVDTAVVGELGYALAEYGVWLPRRHIYVRALGGQFLHDQGVGVDLTRYFGDTRVRVGVRYTSESPLAELEVTLPLGPRRQSRPTGLLRVRVADSWTFRGRSVLEGTNFFTRSRYTAAELPLGPSVVDSLLDGSQLLPGPLTQAWTAAAPHTPSGDQGHLARLMEAPK